MMVLWNYNVFVDMMVLWNYDVFVDMMVLWNWFVNLNPVVNTSVDRTQSAHKQ